MSTIEIGGQTLALSQPADLAASLLATTGLSMAEASQLLVRSAMPALVAMAIFPLLDGDDKPDIVTLGELVAASDLGTVRTALAPFYAPAQPPAPPAPAAAQAPAAAPAAVAPQEPANG